MAGQYSHESSNSSASSSGNPSAIQTPQSDWALQLSQLLGALTQNQYNWAQQQYNTGMGVTNANIDNYMALAGAGAGLAQNLLSRYENVFEPLMNNFIQQAGSYNSASRQKFMMGQAESTAAQADTAARDSAARQLQSYGINPNSGRYEDLLLTSRMQDAATRAGAGTQASVNTAAIGRQMQQQAAQMGQNVPGMTVNALQSAYTGVTGAENAILGQLNTGANLMNTAANFGNAAANANKLPPVGNTTRQQSGTTQGSSSTPGQQDRSKGGGNQGAGTQRPTGQGQGGGGATQQGGVVPYKSWEDPKYKAPDPTQDNGNYGTEGGLDVGGANPALLPDWLNNPASTDNPFGAGSPNQATSPDNTNWADPNGGQQFPLGTGQGPGTNPMGVSSSLAPSPLQTNPNATQDNPMGMPPNWNAQNNGPQDTTGSIPQWQGGNATQYQDNGGFGQQQFDTGSNFDFNNFANSYQDQGQQPAYQDYTQMGGAADQGNFDQGNFDQGNAPQATYDSGASPYDMSGGGGGGSPYDFGGGNSYDNSNSPSYDQSYDPGQFDNSQPQDMSSGNSGGYYANGGQVSYDRGGVLPTTGGPVPRSASPSGGRRTDDINARLNAGEFVIPRDVTQHFGTKHFQDLIAKSRKLRTGMTGPPARAKLKPALNGRPTFASQHMGP